MGWLSTGKCVAREYIAHIFQLVQLSFKLNNAMMHCSGALTTLSHMLTKILIFVMPYIGMA